MPREDRRIIFELDEVYKAVYALCVQKQIKTPPPGNIVSVKEDERDDKIIHVMLNNPQVHVTESSKIKVDYSRDFLAAALMLYCRGQGIPLPKGAQKLVEFGENDVTLRVLIQRF
jgi:hypothetical protein